MPNAIIFALLWLLTPSLLTAIINPFSTAGEDYTSVNQVISFPARGTQIVSFNVPITNDDRVEVDREPFLIRFNIPASSPFASSIVALTGQATIDIIDDDSKWLLLLL